jgi:Ankyrin repeats (3 copies)
LLGESPQEFLDNALKSRGYSVARYNTLDSAYYNPETTLLQQASYGVRLLELIDESNEEGFESCLLAGIHSNPCDEYGASALHRVCRQGNVALLEILLDNDCVVQCADDFGRTPLHEACRCERLCLSLVETLMMQDIHLLYMADASGRLPLEYIKPEHWYDYMIFLEPRIDRYWPSLNRSTRRSNSTVLSATTTCEEQKTECVQNSQPPLTLLVPGSRPAVDPDNALSTDLAWMVASGVIEPEEAISYMDESVLNKFLPTIHQRLNNLAAEEERKEKLHQHNKIHGYPTIVGNDANIDDDLTV